MRKPARDLSAKQQRILEFIGSFLEERGYPPTVRDIQKACAISSTSVVDYNLRILERKELLKRDPEVSRGMELLGAAKTPRTTRVPLLSAIAAGAPLSLPEDVGSIEGKETVEVSREMVRSKENVYALRVKGTSMIDALVDDGDIVLIQPTKEARNGDMVAVWLKLENAVTLKRMYWEKGRVRLQPANSQVAPIYVRPRDVEVQGKVIGVIRSLSS